MERFSKFWTCAALCVGILVLAWPGGVEAEPPSVGDEPALEATGEGDAALIVAVENYAFLPDVPGARETATDWETLFVEGMGLDRSRVFSQIDQSVTREGMLTFAERARNSVEEGATLWFVFIGHGAPSIDGQSGMLVGVDAQSDPSLMENRSLARDRLVEELEKGDHGRTVAVIDACFSGRAHGGGEALAKGVQPVVPSDMDDNFQTGDETIVLSAAKSDQFAGALPGVDRPAFSYLMLGALRGWADDGDGDVTAGEAINFTRRYLRHLDRTQTPQLHGRAESVLASGASERQPNLGSVFRGAESSPPERPEPPETEPEPDDSCKPGQVRIDGICCWPGQDVEDRACRGEPDECPGPRIQTHDGCKLQACSDGRVRAPDGVHCCWDGQTWSEQAGMCVGEPNCPEGYMADDQVCEPDSDGDGVKHELDECPEKAEDYDDVADFDGCPEKDADGDGIPDDEDECPMRGEDFDGFQDEDGCPETGNGSVMAGVVTTVAGGGVALLGGGGFLLAAANRQQLDQRIDDGEVTVSEISEKERQIERQRLVSGIVASTGALTAAIGGIGWAADPDAGRADSEETAWRLEFGPRGARISIDFY